MQEINENIIIDTSMSGVTVGVIKTVRGVLFIDTPLTPKDVQSWRTIAMKNDGGSTRIHVLLDEHFDRTTSTIPIKVPVIAHEKTSKAIQGRPSNFRLPSVDTGSEWELYPEIGPLQWIVPEITFSSEMKLEWDNDMAELDYRPGPSRGAIWIDLPNYKVIFVGDAVVAGEPPFLENADLDQWLEILDILKSNDYKNYTIVSGRSGVVGKNEINDQIKFLNLVKKKLEKYSSRSIDAAQLDKFAISLLDNFPTKTKKMQEHYKARLKWGISQYFNRTLR